MADPEVKPDDHPVVVGAYLVWMVLKIIGALCLLAVGLIILYVIIRAFWFPST